VIFVLWILESFAGHSHNQVEIDESSNTEQEANNDSKAQKKEPKKLCKSKVIAY